ncbi:hypothetical protein FHX42_004630 [Saccharopolyspora lacisalsi]|uniref:Uncharacterized protein n=1 Tax=Halosaccharopolyspora lacisalsi TaxID=1000566 RepID=A0A839E3T6_9PSEU|nr:hypothetical protein [Halosaccharopolyspora lacisalsi]MBA8827246.1 hypothetical protein [Halosaccharopolyspora lacisalsi]
MKRIAVMTVVAVLTRAAAIMFMANAEPATSEVLAVLLSAPVLMMARAKRPSGERVRYS